MSVEDREVLNKKRDIKENADRHPQVLHERILKLEKQIKLKFGNCFQKVRKAFLALDSDYDGKITVEDLLRYFGNDLDIDYDDLKKLITDKDSKK